MSEEEKPFTVSDRRHFTSEGSVRDVEPLDSEPARSGGADTGADASAPEVDFAGFLISLGAQAGSLLESAGGSGEGMREALLGAKSIIAILEMLRDKTEGRRTEQECRVLDALLYELRLGYVRASRAASA
jgi:hypothetical protein